MSKKLSFEEAKPLLLKKFQAITFLSTLKEKHPELFDKNYLIQILQHEIKKTTDKLPEDIENLIQVINNKLQKRH